VLDRVRHHALNFLESSRLHTIRKRESFRLLCFSPDHISGVLNQINSQAWPGDRYWLHNKSSSGATNILKASVPLLQTDTLPSQRKSSNRELTPSRFIPGRHPSGQMNLVPWPHPPRVGLRIRLASSTFLFFDHLHALKSLSSLSSSSTRLCRHSTSDPIDLRSPLSRWSVFYLAICMTIETV
jgi:hypothetical protein